MMQCRQLARRFHKTGSAQWGPTQKHETFGQCWINSGPASGPELIQHWVNVSCLPWVLVNLGFQSQTLSILWQNRSPGTVIDVPGLIITWRDKNSMDLWKILQFCISDRGFMLKFEIVETFADHVYYVRKIVQLINVNEYCFTPHSAQSWQYCDRRTPEWLHGFFIVHSTHTALHTPALWKYWNIVYAQPRWQTSEPSEIRTQYLWVSMTG